jgi:dTDP-3,4-didehydro-2,6-dideoxy-alpha-D-glucose 3-reductase
MRPINIVVWGVGPHAVKNILPATREVPGVILYGVCSRNADIVDRTCDELGCVGWTHPNDMLADGRVDVVYLATPTGLHGQHGELALRAGKHLWCEKPLTENGERTAVLVAMSRERELVLAEGFMYLYHSQFRYLLDIIRSDRIGRMHDAALRFGIPPIDRASFRTEPELGGSAFLDVGSYPVSAITAFFPDVDPEVSFAEMAVARGARVDTSGRAILRLGHDVTATLEWRIESAYRSEIDLWGTQGSVSTERIFSKPADFVPRFRFLDAQGRESFEDGHAENHFVSMLRAFGDLIDDRSAAERERLTIARRARLADRIRDKSRN